MRSLAIFLILMGLFVAPPAFAEISPKELAQELSSRVERVPEFQFIRAEAEKLGVKVYLFGGTAASYGHYVREDMLREAGDKRFPAHRFDYDYTNIFRSTQDLDVVVDGSAAQSAQLEQILKQKFPHFIGGKGAGWEVRPLREARGEKEAILGNPNFLNQHTDSHSTGLVEITKPSAGEIGVKDVRDWDNAKPQFLRDVTEAKLHYYFNPLHGQTERAAKGMNPPIISVIRYLTKAFQYGLELRPEDKAKIREIVDAFKPGEINNSYLQRWVEKNGKKLFQHSMDIENSWNVLEDLGLRKKLIAIKNDAGVKESLAWWMEKEPLRTKPVGQGPGKTAAAFARELGQNSLVVAHETNSYLAYESISRDRSGELNGLISREASIGEAAAYGEGFYTALGRKGARGTGLTIRMELDPLAREGKDFIHAGGFFILRNKAAVKVIPEQIQISVPQYFRQLAQGQDFSEDDRALLEAFRRKVGRTELLSAADKAEILELVKAEASSTADRLKASSLMREWFGFPLAKNHPEIIDTLIQKGKSDLFLFDYIFSKPDWRSNPKWIDWLDTVLKRADADNLLTKIIHAYPELVGHPKFSEWMNALSGRLAGRMGTFAEILANPALEKNPLFVAWVDKLLGELGSSDAAAKHLLIQPHLLNHPSYDRWMEKLLSRNDNHAVQVLKYPHMFSHPKFSQWVDASMNAPRGKFFVAANLFDFPEVQKNPNFPRWADSAIESGEAVDRIGNWFLTQPARLDKWMDIALKSNEPKDDLVNYVFTDPKVQKNPKFSAWMEQLLSKTENHSVVVHYLFNKPAVVGDPNFSRWMDAVVDADKARLGPVPFTNREVIAQEKFSLWADKALSRKAGDLDFITSMLPQPQLYKDADYVRWVNYIIENSDRLSLLFDRGSAFEALKKHPQFWAWMQKIASSGKENFLLAQNVLTLPESAKYPRLFEMVAKSQEVGWASDEDFLKLLKLPHWANHPGVQQLLRKDPTLNDVISFRKALRLGGGIGSPPARVMTKCSLLFGGLADLFPGSR